METEKISYVIIPVLVVVIGMTGFFLSDGSDELSNASTIENVEIYGIESESWENVENEVLDSLEGREEIEFVGELENKDTLVYFHRYATGGPIGNSEKEYIVMVSSTDSQETRTAVFRMGYENKEVVDSYTEESSKPENFTLEDVITTIENEKSGLQSPQTENITENDIEKIGPNYVYTYPPADFGGTIMVNEYTGDTILYATTVWNGTGDIVTPEELTRSSEDKSKINPEEIKD